jgi:hypothetical protein
VTAPIPGRERQRVSARARYARRTGSQAHLIRAWARAAGYPVDSRGALPLLVLAAYRERKREAS